MSVQRRDPMIAALLTLLAAAHCGCQREVAVQRSSQGPAAVPQAAEPVSTRPSPFLDRAAELGIDFVHRNGEEADHSTILESLGGGVGWIDFDRDGWPDLVATGGGGLTSDEQIYGLPSVLYRNIEGRRFEPVTQHAGIDTSSLYSHGVTVGDYDNDGFQDLLITGYGPPQLWRNMGDGTFLESTTDAGIRDGRWSSSAGWADLNGDGHLDLYLAHYVDWTFQNHPYCQGTNAGDRDICPPREFLPLPDVIYYSQGDGTFFDATEVAGLRADGKGLGVLLCDVDLDGDVDIYVANDTTDNFLYLNDGQGQFQEQAILRGVAVDAGGIPNGSMGVDLCDFNADGLPDLWVANYEQESFALYRNEGNGIFLHVSQRFGITDLGGLFVGFGTACDDFSGDGIEEFVVANGHVIKYPSTTPRKQLPLLLEYDGKRFKRARFEAGSYFEQPHEGRGLATADFDRDGDLDIAISHLNEPLALLENRYREDNRWLALSLVGVRCNRDAVGARVVFETSTGRRMRQVTGGGSYLSHSSRTLHFSLPGDAQPQRLIVHWPAGVVQTIDASSLVGEVTLVEPAADGDLPRLFPRQVQR